MVGWLLDASIFDAYHDELASAIIRNGHSVVSINRPNPPYNWDDTADAYRRAFATGTCVVTHADIDLVLRVLDEELWTPGAFANIASFFCSKYFAHLGKYLLNSDYVMLPYAELQRCRDFLFDTLGQDDRLFVRPDSPLKIFTGMTISRSTFDRDFEFMGFYEFPLESLVVVSSPKTIVAEWRFVVAGKAVVTGSQYLDGSEKAARPVSDVNAFNYAQSIVAAGYSPDSVWVLDVCKTEDGEYHLLEIGGFSFAGLYGCDKDAVVKAVSAVAQQIHTTKSHNQRLQRSP